MKTQRFLRIVLSGALVIMLNACATYSNSGTSSLVGNWTNSLGTVWMIKADGTFEVDLTHNGKRDTWGTYTISADTITIHSTGGITPKGCKGDGVYHFSRPSADSLQFTLVKDRCKMRVKNVTLDWKPKH